MTRPAAIPSRVRSCSALFAMLALSSCGGGGGGGPPPLGSSYSVGGYVSGLVGSGLTVSYNGGAPIAVARNGAITFAQSAPAGTQYSVAVAGEPGGPQQKCTVANGSGTVGNANVTSISVYCPQAAGTLAYVVNQGSVSAIPVTLGTISVYAITATSGALTLVPHSTVTTGPQVVSFQFVPHSAFAWALSLGASTTVPDTTYNLSGVYDYQVGTTGALTPVAGSPFFALAGGGNTAAACPSGGIAGVGITQGVSFAASGAFGYAANGTGTVGYNPGVWTFTISSANGAPVALGTSAPGVCSGDLVTIDPSGQFAYTVGSQSAQVGAPYGIFAFTLAATSGALTAVPATPWQQLGDVDSGTASVTIDPAGRFAYVDTATQIWAFTINPASGALTPVSGSPFAVPSASTGMAIEPHGQFAYVSASDSVYVYSIAANGVLAMVSSITLAGAAGIAIDPSGQFAYVSGMITPGPAYQGIYGYTIDSDTGALTAIAGSPFAAAPQPAAAAVMAISN
jgi:6-phosphogluconolactonase